MIIITGGAGFIGSNLVKSLNNRGLDDILVVDNMGCGEKYRNLNPLRLADYLDKNDFLSKVQNGDFAETPVEAVFHIGACADTMEYNGNYMVQNNFEYSKTLLHFCQSKRIPFIYASSASVYGDGKNGFSEKPECEKALNVYAFSKLMFDRYVRHILPKAASQIVGLRFFNVYGPQENHKGKMASIVFQLYNQLQKEGFLKLFQGYDGYEAGEQRRDFIYVKDVVNVNLFFWKNPGLSGIYNCGTGTANTFNAVARAIIKACGKGHIEYVEFPEVLKGKYQSYTQADSTKLLNAGYTDGFTTLEDAVKEYVDYLQKNNGYLEN